MNLRKNESCLIVTDSKLKSIGNALYKNSLKITKQSKLILTTIPKAHGEEPPQKITDEMLKHDVILMYSKSDKITFNALNVLEKREDEVLRRLSTGVESATMAANKSKYG